MVSAGILAYDGAVTMVEETVLKDHSAMKTSSVVLQEPGDVAGASLKLALTHSDVLRGFSVALQKMLEPAIAEPSYPRNQTPTVRASCALIETLPFDKYSLQTFLLQQWLLQLLQYVAEPTA